MISLRIVFYAFLTTAVAVVGHAQDSRGEKPETNSSSSAATKKPRSSSDRVIIKVGGVQVTEKEFEASIGEIEPKGGEPDKGGEVEKNRRRLGDDYATVLMLSELAVANHLDSSPDIRQKLAVARMQVLSDAQFSRLLSETTPSSEELSKYYDAHASDFDRVQVRRLFIWKVGGGSKNTHGLSPEDAKAREAAILQASASGAEAEKLAEMLNRSEQGLFDAQPLTFTRGELPANLNKVAFSMKVGAWAEAEDTPDRTILLYLVGRDRQSLVEVKSQVEKLVHGEKMEAKLNQLKKNTGVWMDKQYFSSGSAVANDPGEQRPVSDPPSGTR